MGSIVLWDSSPDPSLPMDNVGKILLLTAADIVRYSFIVRKSLTYLDLSICEYSNGEKLCFTKDELKNLFLSKRYVTYFYHLDVPWRLDDVNGCSKFGYNYRDYSLYCFQQPVLVVDGIIHKISMKPHIETAVQKTNNKIRALMKFSKFLSFQELDLSENFIDYLKLISEEKDDSDLVCQFLQIQPQLVGRVFFSHYDQHLVDFILYHCTLAQFRFFEGHTRISWEHCMYYRHYESFYYLIKYGYSYPFFEEDFLDCLRGVAQLHLSEDALLAEHPLSNFLSSYRRQNLFLLTVLFLLNSIKPKRLQFTDMAYIFWQAIPDPFFTKEELSEGCDELQMSQTNRNAFYEIYKCNISSGFLLGLTPRSLLHLCRCSIRELMGSLFKLPHGIDELKIPEKLKKYLRLNIPH